MTRRSSLHRGATALERRDALFQHRHGRIGQARIHVAEIVQVEERGGVIDVIEHVSRRLVDRSRPGAGGQIEAAPAWMGGVSKPWSRCATATGGS